MCTCEKNQQQVFEGKSHGVHPQNGIPGFSLHFPKELSNGYLWFEGNGKIPLRRQGKRCLKGRAYSKK